MGILRQIQPKDHQDISNMRSTYFIIDFSYNPDDAKPLAIFEFGDAFESGYPDKKLFQYLF